MASQSTAQLSSLLKDYSKSLLDHAHALSHPVRLLTTSGSPIGYSPMLNSSFSWAKEDTSENGTDAASSVAMDWTTSDLRCSTPDDMCQVPPQLLKSFLDEFERQIAAALYQSCIEGSSTLVLSMDNSDCFSLSALKQFLDGTTPKAS